jgi:type IV pilus assembly protein PilM
VKGGLQSMRPPRRRSPIGLDVGAKRVKAIQLEPGDAAGTWRVVAAATTPRAGAGATGALLTAGEAAAVADLLYRAGFEGRHVIMSAPSSSVVQSVLDLPPRASQAPVEQIARLELARAHRCDPESFEMGCWDLPAPHRTGGQGPSKGTHLMAVALPHAAAAALLDPFEACGLRADALDIAPCALYRACTAVMAPPGAITGILDIGWDAAVLSLLYRGAVVYQRSLAEAGMGQLHAAVARRLGLEPDVTEFLLTDLGLTPEAREAAGRTAAPAAASAEGDHALDPDLVDDARRLLTTHVDSLAGELRVSFSYATHQYPDATVGKLLLAGGGAAMPGMAAHLAATLGVTAMAVSPSDLAECDVNVLGLCGSPAMTAAMGLAMFPRE